MKKIFFILIISGFFLSCDGLKNYSEQVPKCNDSIPVRLTKDLVRKSIAALKMAELTHTYFKECYKMIEEYKSGKRYDNKINMQIETVIANAESVDLRIEEIIPTKIDEKLKKCDCEASLIIKENKMPISYSAQNTDEGTYVTMKDY